MSKINALAFFVCLFVCLVFFVLFLFCCCFLKKILTSCFGDEGRHGYLNPSGRSGET